jgi:hypothetical protein
MTLASSFVAATVLGLSGSVLTSLNDEVQLVAIVILNSNSNDIFDKYFIFISFQY